MVNDDFTVNTQKIKVCEKSTIFSFPFSIFFIKECFWECPTENKKKVLRHFKKINVYHF